MRERIKDSLSLRGVASRISLLFLLAAFLPVMALTAMIYGIVSDISREQGEHKKIDISRAYSTKVFERLLLAESAMQRLSGNLESAGDVRELLFTSIAMVAQDGRILQRVGDPLPASLQTVIPQSLPSGRASHKTAVHVLGKPDAIGSPAIALSLHHPVSGHPQARLVATLNPIYLWGDPEAESQEFNTCFFGEDHTQLFCIYPEAAPKNVAQIMANQTGAWVLFLNGRFHAANWMVITQDRYPGSPTAWNRFFSIYIQVAFLTVFLVALLSLYQIRRTIGPLGKLIDGTRRIAHGDYAPLEVKTSGEFRELTVAINDMSGQISDQIRTLQAHEERFRHQARFDSLTGLVNRRTLFAMIESLVEAADGEGLGAVLLMDIDRFKFFNNAMGHSGGDHLLRLIARRLENLIGADDTVGRMTGDEFVVILRHRADREAIRQSVEDIIAGMNQPFNLEGNDYDLTCSIGVAVFPQDASNPEMIVEAADMAVYESKKKGRNNYHFFTPSMRETQLDRLKLDTDVRHALERNEFFLLYQPKVEARTGRIMGAEALIRWAHPKLGMVTPDKFIPLIEEIGLIVPIGQWVMETACAQAKQWRDAGFTDFRVSVNLSAHQFVRHDLVSTVQDVLAETGLPAHCLELELTESALMENIAQGIDTLEKLRALNVQLSIDDFGTGYSSLYYLKRFPIHAVKIDRGFITDLTETEEDAAIVHSIISLAHNLKLQVVAEGVETESQRKRLIAAECDLLQGYLFSRPVKVEEITQMLARQKK